NTRRNFFEGQIYTRHYNRHLDVWITPGTGNGNGQGRSVALDGGHTSQGCTDAIGKMCVNPP
ncbi:MAG: hypothetical protein WCF23_22095, partial [Candidatus Nitrosopolaris sp.]